ncbi:MAG: phosphatase PAP2 family protein [Candidatus Aenigmarchaeota archaeon]|nr:phosphatase PAP2 family protein [Candidatus Aenigmarchaeota archaeon]
MPYDPITTWISQLNIPLLTVIAKILDSDMVFLAIIFLFAFLAEHGKKRNKLMLILILIFMFGFAMKLLIHEVRPCTEIVSKIQCPNDFSFPSNHTLVASAFAVALWKKRNGWIFSIFTVFVAFTRVYLGVHTITDVLGGAALGIAAYLLADILWKRIPEKFKKKLGVME